MDKELKISIVIPVVFFVGILSLNYSEHILNIVFLGSTIFTFIFGIIWAIILSVRWVRTRTNKGLLILLAISPLLFLPVSRLVSNLKEQPIFSAEYDGPISGEYLDLYDDNTVKYVESSLLGRDIYHGTFQRANMTIKLYFEGRIPDTISQERTMWELKDNMLSRIDPNTQSGVYYLYVTKNFEE
jgi:hypothetical protein